MEKSFGVESVEVYGEAGSGKFEALVSVFGNIDAVKDVVMPTGFNRAIKDSDPPPVVWSHFWNVPPIGNTIDWAATEKGLQIKGELFVGADDKHQYADMVYAAMKSREGRKPALREFSFSYDIPEGGMKLAERGEGDETIKVQELHEIYPVHEVGPCLRGCNNATELIVAPKVYGAETISRLERLAIKRGLSVPDLLAQLEDEEESVPSETYSREWAELLLAVPDH